ncbi:MAG: phosphonate metabolism transcriptional regulator PhnF [Trichodesmium sp.]
MTRENLTIYNQIAEELRHNINQGIYQVGDKLPSESELSEYFQVNRHTLRRAIAVLKHEGILKVAQGKGTFVVGKPIKYLIGKRVRYNQNLRGQGHKSYFKLLQVVEITADVNIANKLELEIGDAVALVERLGFADNQTLSINSSYFPLFRFPEIVEQKGIEFLQEKGSISQFLKELYNCDHIRYQTHVYARIVESSDASILEVPLNHPILLAESINVDQDGKIIEYGMTRFRGDRMELVFES